MSMREVVFALVAAAVAYLGLSVMAAASNAETPAPAAYSAQHA